MQTVKFHSITNATSFCPYEGGMQNPCGNQMNHPCPGDDSNGSECRPIDVAKNNAPKQTLGMSYVPGQKWNRIYEITNGFDKGTIFSELDKPLLVKGCNR